MENKHDEFESFENFVWSCARRMGPLVYMRDDDADAPISLNQVYEGSISYNKECIEGTEKKLASLQAQSDEDYKKMSDNFVDARKIEYAKEEEEKRIKKQRLEKMLEHINMWNPPAEDYVPLKEYMQKRIANVIEWYCSPSDYYGPQEGKSRQENIEILQVDLKRFNKNIQKEKENAKKRSNWLITLNSSVPRPDHLIPESEKEND